MAFKKSCDRDLGSHAQQPQTKALYKEWVPPKDTELPNLARECVEGGKVQCKKAVCPCEPVAVCEPQHVIRDLTCLPDQVLEKQPTVIIIGAGMAGLSAAQRLVQSGITNFRILEATERAGGRIKSQWYSDTMVEMGAEAITGATIANPVFTMAVQDRLVITETPRVEESDSIFFTSTGTVVNQGITKRMEHLFRSLEQKAANIFNSFEAGSGTLGSFLEREFLEELEKAPPHERYEMSRAFYGYMNELQSRLGIDPAAASLKYFGSSYEMGGGVKRVPLGMSALVAPLIRTLPDCSILYCKPVHCIRWGTAGSGNPRAVVRACDGEEFPCDFVIVTVPLGVLKKYADTMFCPNLPASKMTAIEKLGVGHIVKIFLEREDPSWRKIDFVWTPKDRVSHSDWTKNITSFKAVTVAGEGAQVAEKLSKEKLAIGVIGTLRQFLGDSGISYPSDCIVTKWSTQPYTLGAFTTMAEESSVGNIADLASPLPDEFHEIPPIILFAGEHTHRTDYATLQGARWSGFREAERIIDITLKLGGAPTPREPCWPPNTKTVHPICPPDPPPKFEPPCPPCEPPKSKEPKCA